MVKLIRYWGAKPYELAQRLAKKINTNIVIDPFGGSGILLLPHCQVHRRVIYNDINPYAVLVAYVVLSGFDVVKFQQVAELVLRRAKNMELRKVELYDDDLMYKNGRQFYKQRRALRISDFFDDVAKSKLYNILVAIDEYNTDIRTKAALYLSYCKTLYESSKMRTGKGGAWPMPTYWLPLRNEPKEPFKAFIDSVTHMIKVAKKYKPCHQSNVEFRMEDAFELEYDNSWSLVTDPPFFDEVQYLELSFFYWVWLKNTKFVDLIKEITGKTPNLEFEKEFVVNPNRNMSKEVYLDKFVRFLEKTKYMRVRVMIFHEEGKDMDVIRQLVMEHWGNVVVEETVIKNPRHVGPKGSETYYIFYAVAEEKT